MKDRNGVLRIAALCALGLGLAACQTTPEETPAASHDRQAQQVVAEVVRAEALKSKARGDLTKAAEEFGKLYAMNPDDREVVIAYLQSLRGIGASRDAYRIATERGPAYEDDLDFLLEAARIELTLGKKDEALATLDKAREVEPRNWEVYSLQGIARDARGEFSRAVESYRTALELSPDNPVVQNNLALSLAQAGDIDGAIAVLRGLLGSSSADNAKIRQNLAMLYGFKGNLKELETLNRMDLSEEMVRRNLEAFRAAHGGTGADKGGTR